MNQKILIKDEDGPNPILKQIENKMEELKYYTPDIEDIRIGYECEVNNAKGYKKTFEPLCIGYKIDGGYEDEIGEIIAMIDDGYGEVRTPYLTKEQIEAEGWNISVGKDYRVTLFRKDIYILGYNWENKMLKVTTFEKESQTLYNGSCSSINEFRYICKLLNIK